jgi:hypothetical protein
MGGSIEKMQAHSASPRAGKAGRSSVGPKSWTQPRMPTLVHAGIAAAADERAKLQAFNEAHPAGAAGPTGEQAACPP